MQHSHKQSHKKVIVFIVVLLVAVAAIFALQSVDLQAPSQPVEQGYDPVTE